MWFKRAQIAGFGRTSGRKASTNCDHFDRRSRPRRHGVHCLTARCFAGAMPAPRAQRKQPLHASRR
jgi:hypothetical protein